MPLIDASHPSICGAPLFFMIKQNKKKKNLNVQGCSGIGTKKQKLIFFQGFNLDECKKQNKKKKKKKKKKKNHQKTSKKSMKKI